MSDYNATLPDGTRAPMPGSNLVKPGEFTASAVNHTTRELATGELQRGSAGLTADQARGNTHVVQRDGIYVAPGASGYQPGDIITMGDGLQVEYTQAVQLGVISESGDPTEAPAAPPSTDAEPPADPSASNLELPIDVATLRDAFTMQAGEHGDALFSRSVADVLDHGELLEDTRDTIARDLGMSPEQAQSIAREKAQSVLKGLGDVLDGGDGQGADRANFIAFVRSEANPEVRAKIDKAFVKHIRGEMTAASWENLYDEVHDYWERR